MNNLVEELYLPRTLHARQRLFGGVGDALVGSSISAPELELFFICFSARGVRMTEPVEGWIFRAGERCTAVGLERLGRALKIHATQEANHHLMMIEDTKTLVDRWNRRHNYQFDASALLDAPATPGIDAYVKLHEDVIGSQAPFCQLAIEYEIEGLSVTLGPKLMQQVERMLGKEILQGLSFLREHVEVDAGHTLFNRAELERLLLQDSTFAQQLGRVGSAALDAYAQFLTECLSWAKQKWAAISTFERRPEAVLS